MTDKSRVLSFGEILLRASPDKQGNWLEKGALPIYLGGAECNVAHALALWGCNVSYFSALPDNYMSEGIKAYLERKKIDSSRMIMAGERIGIYFLEQGADLKNRAVIYDRAASSFASLLPGSTDWEKVLDGVDWLHFSAISPALNENAVKVCDEILRCASSKNITISLDLNYRAKLWQYGKKPHEIVPQLARYADLIMGNIWAANTLLGVKLNEKLISKNSKEAYLEHAAWTAGEIGRQFPKAKIIANTFRFTEGKKVNYYATLHRDGKDYTSPEFRSSSVIDTVGSGDCFMAGLIYGNLNGFEPQKTINYAAAAAFGKLHVLGDTTTQSVGEIEKIMINNA